MCRLFGMISNEAMTAEYPLRAAAGSLLRLSRIRHQEIQKDGWGVGWFRNGRPTILKSPDPIYRDAALLRQAAKQAKGKVVIGHVRWASNPLKLPKSRLIGMDHTQPFSFRQWLFAHNGTLLIPNEVRSRLGSLNNHIRGNNDSEVLFYWLMKHWPNLKSNRVALCGRPIYRAVQKSLKDLDLIWRGCRKKYPLYKHPSHGLNWVMSNGKILVALCYVNPDGFGKARALNDRRKPYYQMSRRLSSQGLMIASEPADPAPGWTGFQHGELVIADASGAQYWKI